MMFHFRSILQIWIILIGFRDKNDFVNFGICKYWFKFTCHGYCRQGVFQARGGGGGNFHRLGYRMCHFLRVLSWLKNKFLGLFYSL